MALQPDPDEKSALQSLTEKLYSRMNRGKTTAPEHDLASSDIPVGNDWSPPNAATEVIKRRIPYLAIIVVASLVFSTAVFGYGLYLLLGSSNRVSSGNVEIGISGPLSVRGGEPMTLNISVKNSNVVPLELVDLLVEYPKGTRSPTDPTKELRRYREGLGTIKAGAEVTRPISAILFGEERTVQDIKITIEYRLPDSNAIFYKESAFQVTIISSPLSITVSTPAEHVSGQEISFIVTLTSNSETVTKDILLHAEYPSGFSFKSADPAPYFETSVWRLGDMRPESKRTVTIRGVLAADEGDHRIFRFEAGLVNEQSDTDISIPFATAAKDIAVSKPFMSLGMTVGGSKDSEVAVGSGRIVRIDIPYINNLTEAISDVEITLSLAGNALDRQSVSPERGFFRSLDNAVLWNRGTDPSLASVPPGEGGVVSLILTSLQLPEIAAVRSPEINLIGSVRGRYSAGSGVPQEVIGQVSRHLKVESPIQFSPRILHFTGPITNSGPIPPKVEQNTTYTVTWAVGSASNDVTDAKVSATLPPYVRFQDSVTPATEHVTFNPVGGTVVWDAGLIRAGTGFSSPPKEVSFQIVFTPSLSQVGSVPTLVNEMEFSGVDRFTGTTLSLKRPALTTKLSTDSGVKSGDEVVVK